MTRCFMHIPKSGGVSVAAALEEAAPPESIAPQNLDGALVADRYDLATLPPELRATVAATEDDLAQLRAHRFVCGHFSLPTLERVAPPSEIVTTLREPRARLLSLYAYWRYHQAELDAGWGDVNPHRQAL